MGLLAQILVNGILLGGLYAVMALGLALVWGVLNIVNLAHGAFIMLGAYASWYLYTYAHIDPFLGLPITAVVMFALGYALQRGLLNLVIRAPMFNTLLITFGLEVVFTYLAQLMFSADFRTINPPYAGNSLAWGPVVLPLVRRAHEGATEHVGKVPAKRKSAAADRQVTSLRLRRELQKAVDAENYEQAAQLRDKLRTLEEN